ncbi:hypothetical protein GCM10017673_18440 [Streptosporangium violaceochromogenes]|nr:hypothetical protein GCM10017673_18440 [Streptosporangium violaceochromogenes]
MFTIFAASAAAIVVIAGISTVVVRMNRPAFPHTGQDITGHTEPPRHPPDYGGPTESPPSPALSSDGPAEPGDPTGPAGQDLPARPPTPAGPPVPPVPRPPAIPLSAPIPADIPTARPEDDTETGSEAGTETGVEAVAKADTGTAARAESETDAEATVKAAAEEQPGAIRKPDPEKHRKPSGATDTATDDGPDAPPSPPPPAPPTPAAPSPGDLLPPASGRPGPHFPPPTGGPRLPGGDIGAPFSPTPEDRLYLDDLFGIGGAFELEIAPSLPSPHASGPRPSRSLVFDAAGRTNAGRRGENADGFLIQDRLIAVADGVTASTESRWASALALGAVVGDQAGSPPDPLRGLQDSLEVANQTLREMGRGTPELIGMATALDLVTLAESGGTWVVAFAHVGSGAVYSFTGPEEGRILTTAHRFGEGPPPRAIGTEERLRSEVDRVDALPGSLVVVATNGLTDVLSFPEIQGVVRRHFTAPPHACAGALLDAAYRRSAADDVTVVVARVIEVTHYIWPSTPPMS